MANRTDENTCNQEPQDAVHSDLNHKNYDASAKGRERHKKYNASAKGRERHKKYDASAKGSFRGVLHVLEKKWSQAAVKSGGSLSERFSVIVPAVSLRRLLM